MLGVPSREHVATALGMAPSKQVRMLSMLSMVFRLQRLAGPRSWCLKESFDGCECNRTQIVGTEPEQRAHELLCIAQRANFRDKMIAIPFREFDIPLLCRTGNCVFPFALDGSMIARAAEDSGDLL